MARILYSGTRNASSWAFRAWLALREGGIEFEEHVVDIRKPQRFDNLKRIGEFSPPAAVPVLVDGDTVVFDSLAIMEYANDLASGRLLPLEPLSRARARSFLAWQHAGLSGLCPRLSFESAFYPDKRAMSADEQAQSARAYDAFEQQLAGSGGPCLAGELSLADLAMVPTLLRLVSHTPAETLAQWPRVAEWNRRLMARESVREWLSEANTLPPVRLDDYMA